MDELELEKLKAEAEAAQEKKGLLGAFGGALQDVVNVPSAYQLLKGKGSAAPDIKSGFDALAGSISDPWEKQKKTYEMYKAAKENKDLERENAYIANLEKGDSAQSKAIKAMGVKAGLFSQADAANMSGLDALKFIDPKKYGETQAQAEVNFNNQKALRLMDERFKEKERSLDREHEIEKTTLAKKNREIPAGTAETLAASDAADKQIETLEGSLGAIEEFNKMGVLNPFRYTPGADDNTKKETFENQQKSTMQTIGTFLEGGKLTDEDFKSKYLPMAPGLNDSVAVRKNKIANLKRLVAERKNALKDNLGNAGFDVSRFGSAPESPPNPLSQKTDRGQGKKKVKDRFVNRKTGEVKEIYEDGSFSVSPGSKVGKK